MIPILSSIINEKYEQRTPFKHQEYFKDKRFGANNYYFLLSKVYKEMYPNHSREAKSCITF